jgi:heat shock protein HtpX
MPFSFVQIEKDKTRSIEISLAVLVLFYILGILLIVAVVKAMTFGSSSEALLYRPRLFGDILDWNTTWWSLAGAGGLGAVHWKLSVSGLISKTLQLMGARPLDLARNDERTFRNVVDEAQIATGGKRTIEACVIPTSALNAFAIQDFEGAAVIGITEGLLKRLNREQLEAVVAHEAGHIASGDSLSTAVTCSLFKAFDNVCDLARVFLRFGAFSGGGRRRNSGGGQLALVALVVFLIATALRFLGYLGSLFVSREREYRADALAARLTRNPMALAEALHIIDSHWKGGGTAGSGMDALYILSPRKRAIEEREGFFSDLFSTHPPVARRINILMDMAHASTQDLESSLKKSELRYQTLHPEIPGTVQEASAVRPGTPAGGINIPVGIPIPGNFSARPALTGIGAGGVPILPVQKDMCPRCRVSLNASTYEGFDILSCGSCGGSLVTEENTLQIIGRQEQTFDARVAGLAKLVLEQQPLLRQTPFDRVYDEKSIYCPHCVGSSPRMTRRFVNQKYPVEIDKCRVCTRVWFDKDELDILQYLYERDHPRA